MNELKILAAVTNTERMLAGMVEAERNEAAKARAQRDEAVALLRQIYGLMTSDDVTVNYRTEEAVMRMADWVRQSEVFAEGPLKFKKNFSARVEVGHV